MVVFLLEGVDIAFAMLLQDAEAWLPLFVRVLCVF